MDRLIVLRFLILAISLVGLTEKSVALEVVHEGVARPGEFVAGLRAGPAFSYYPNLSTVGPALSFQGLYGVNKWLCFGMVIDWTKHGIERTDNSLSTVTLLPLYVEFHPGRIGDLEPYVASGIGVNINNQNTANTMAFKTAGGVDYHLSKSFARAPKGLALNTEVAYTRNTTGGQDLGSVALLFGARWSFGSESE